MAGYKHMYEQEKARWNKLKAYLEKASNISKDMGGKNINYDPNTVTQVLFVMTTFEDAVDVDKIEEGKI